MNALRQRRAAAGMQYAMVIGLVAVVAIVAVAGMGLTSRNLMFKVTNVINGQYVPPGESIGPPPQDTAPDAFSFTDQTGVTPGATISSNAVTVGGFDGTIGAACGSGCTGIARNGSWGGTSVPGFVAGDTIAIRQTAPAGYSDVGTATVTLGTTTSGVWSVNTGVQDVSPDPFGFSDQVNVALGATVESAPVTPAGYDGPLNASCNGGCTSIARNGSWGGPNVTGFMPGDTIAIRMVASGSHSTPVTGSVSLGTTGSSTWTITTLAQDTEPDAFSFTNQTNVTASTTISSNAVSLSGFTGTLTASCGSGCTAIARNGSWGGTSVSGFAPGDTIAIRQTSSSAGAMATTATVTVGATTSSAWSVTTAVGAVTEYTTAGSYSYTTPVSGTYRIIVIGGGGTGGSGWYGGGQGGCSGYGNATNVSLGAGVTLSVNVGDGGAAEFVTTDGRAPSGGTSFVQNGGSTIVSASGGLGGLHGGSPGTNTSETTDNTGCGGSGAGRGGGYGVGSSVRGRGGATNGGAVGSGVSPGSAGSYYNTFDNTITHGTGGTATNNYGAESDSGGGGGGGFNNAIKLTIDNNGGIGARGYGAGGGGAGGDGGGERGVVGYVRIVRP